MGVGKFKNSVTSDPLLIGHVTKTSVDVTKAARSSWSFTDQ